VEQFINSVHAYGFTISRDQIRFKSVNIWCNVFILSLRSTLMSRKLEKLLPPKSDIAVHLRYLEFQVQQG